MNVPIISEHNYVVLTQIRRLFSASCNPATKHRIWEARAALNGIHPQLWTVDYKWLCDESMVLVCIAYCSRHSGA